MEWNVKYEPRRGEEPWGVYRTVRGKRFFEESFETEEEARFWAQKREKRFADPSMGRADAVDEASMESFPASDAPAWTKMAIKRKDSHAGR